MVRKLLFHIASKVWLPFLAYFGPTAHRPIFAVARFGCMRAEQNSLADFLFTVAILIICYLRKLWSSFRLRGRILHHDALPEANGIPRETALDKRMLGRAPAGRARLVKPSLLAAMTRSTKSIVFPVHTVVGVRSFVQTPVQDRSYNRQYRIEKKIRFTRA